MKRILSTALVILMSAGFALSANAFDRAERKAELLKKWKGLSKEAKKDMVLTAKDKIMTSKEVHREKVELVKERLSRYEPKFRELAPGDVVKEIESLIRTDNIISDPKAAEMALKHLPKVHEKIKPIKPLLLLPIEEIASDIEYIYKEEKEALEEKISNLDKEEREKVIKEHIIEAVEKVDVVDKIVDKLSPKERGELISKAITEGEMPVDIGWLPPEAMLNMTPEEIEKFHKDAKELEDKFLEKYVESKPEIGKIKDAVKDVVKDLSEEDIEKLKQKAQPVIEKIEHGKIKEAMVSGRNLL